MSRWFSIKDEIKGPPSERLQASEQKTALGIEASDRKTLEFSTRLREALLRTNLELQEIARLLREIQPKRSGAVLLHLHQCGKAGCRGCPHARFSRWEYLRGRGKGRWAARYIEHPLKGMRKSPGPEFDEVWPEVVALVRRAVDLLGRRGELLQRIKATEQTLSALERALENH